MSQPKRKPWYRPRNIVFMALLLFVVLIAYSIIWAFNLQPTRATDYSAELTQLARDAQPEGDNGWPDILRAIELYNRLNESLEPRDGVPLINDVTQFDAIYDEDGFDLETLFNPSLTKEELREAQITALNWLATNGAWDALAAAGAKPNIVKTFDVQDGTLLDLLLPELMPMRGLARARLATMHLALLGDDRAEAVQAARDILTLARANEQQPIIISSLVGSAIRQLLYGYIQDAIQAGRIDTELARELLDAIEANPPNKDITLALEGERCMVLDIIQDLYSDNGNGDGTLIYAKAVPLVEGITGNGLIAIDGDEGEAHWITNLAGPAFASRAQVTVQANELHDALITAARTPAPANVAKLQAIDTDVMNLSWRYAVIQPFFGALTRTVETHNFLHQQHDATRIMLAIELFRAENGKLPATLDDLASQLGGNVPIDRISGLPFGYHLLEDDPAGRDYLLYSLGQDGVDDGGVEPKGIYPDNPTRWSKFNVNGDFVINRAPEAEAEEE